MSSNSFDQPLMHSLWKLQLCHFGNILRGSYFYDLENYSKLPDGSMSLIDHIQSIILQCLMQYFYFGQYSLLWLFQSKNDLAIFPSSNDAHIWWMCIIYLSLHFITLDQIHLGNIWHTSFVVPSLCNLSNSKASHSYPNPFEVKLGRVDTHHV